MTRPTPERLEWIRELSRECYPPDALLDAMDEIDALTHERDEAQAERDRALRIVARLREAGSQGVEILTVLVDEDIVPPRYLATSP